MYDILFLTCFQSLCCREDSIENAGCPPASWAVISVAAMYHAAVSRKASAAIYPFSWFQKQRVGLPKASIYALSYYFYEEEFVRTLVIPLIRQTSPDSVILVGGPHATLNPAWALALGADGVGLGDGVDLILNVLEAAPAPDWRFHPNVCTKDHKGKVAPPSSRFSSIVLNPQAFVDPVLGEQMLSEPEADVFVAGKLGCDYACSFCSNELLYGTSHLYRSPDIVASDIIIASQNPSTTTIVLTDPSLCLPSTYPEALPRFDAILSKVSSSSTFRVNTDLSGFLKPRDVTNDFLYLLKQYPSLNFRFCVGLDSFDDVHLRNLQKAETFDSIYAMYENLFPLTNIKSIYGMILFGAPEEPENLVETSLNKWKKIRSLTQSRGLDWSNLDAAPLMVLPYSRYYYQQERYPDIIDTTVCDYTSGLSFINIGLTPTRFAKAEMQALEILQRGKED